MRILFCNKYNFGFSGTEAYLFETMELMRSRGHEVALFSMADERGRATVYDQHFVPHLDFKGDHTLPAQARLALYAIYSPQAREKIRHMIADFHPDVAHVRNIYHHLSPSILWELKAQRVPVLYHMNDFKLLCPSYNMVAQGRARAMLAINPDLIDMDKANAEFPPFPEYTVNTGPVHTAFFFTAPGSVYWATKSGTWGDARQATPEMGERYLQLSVKSTLAVLENIEKTFAALPVRT
jgi:hypothetical protein